MHYSIIYNNSINKNVCKCIKCSYINSDLLHASANHVTIALQAWTGPWVSKMSRILEFLDNRHMKMVRLLSALSTGRLYLPEGTPGTHFCWRLSRPQGQNAAERIKSMKNHNDLTGDITRYLSACSAVPQPPAAPRIVYN